MSFDSLGKSFSVRRGEKTYKYLYVRADSWARGCGEGDGGEGGEFDFSGARYEPSVEDGETAVQDVSRERIPDPGRTPEQRAAQIYGAPK